MTVQDLNFSVSAAASATGTATFTFQVIPLSQTWTFTVNVPGAPDTAVHTATSGGTIYAVFKGSNSYGAIQLGVHDQLVITTTGLVPGVVYSALLDGVSHTVEPAPDIWPQPYADTVTTSTQQILLQTGKTSVSATTPSPIVKVVPLPPNYRSLYVAVYATGTVSTDVGSILVQVVGNQSGVSYQEFLPPYLTSNLIASGANTNYIARFPIVNGLDTTVTVTINPAIQATGGGNFRATGYAIGADLANVDALIYAGGTPSSISGSVSPSINALGVSQNWATVNVLGQAVADYPANSAVDPFYEVLIGGYQPGIVILTSTTAAALYTFPAIVAGGMKLRLHAVSVYGGTSSQTVQLYINNGLFNLSLAQLVAGGGTGSYLTLNGQIVDPNLAGTGGSSVIYAKLSAFTAAVTVTLWYDIVKINQTYLNNA